MRCSPTSNRRLGTNSGRMEGRFRKADTDSDGSLTRDEAKAMPRVAKNFDVIDADKSGTVTEKEIHDYMKGHCQKRRKN
jgi:Ca2+-binding EF-hand superfamily protein